MIEKLATSRGRKDEKPNTELAVELVKTRNIKGIEEILEGLHHENKKIVHDCIKVLYEIAKQDPSLVARHVETFIRLLRSADNRLVWGAMTALSYITPLAYKRIYDNFDTILRAYEKGSVITIDNCISVFAELVNAGEEYTENVFPVIITHLETCRPKDVAQHAERAFVCITEENAEIFKRTIGKRRESLKDSQKKRIDKLLKKIDEGRFSS